MLDTTRHQPATLGPRAEQVVALADLAPALAVLVLATADEAFAADRPVVVEFYTDPNVPPLPPHITLDEARALASSMFGEPELGSVLKNTAKQMVASLLPGAFGEGKEEPEQRRS